MNVDWTAKNVPGDVGRAPSQENKEGGRKEYKDNTGLVIPQRGEIDGRTRAVNVAPTS